MTTSQKPTDDLRERIEQIRDIYETEGKTVQNADQANAVIKLFQDRIIDLFATQTAQLMTGQQWFNRFQEELADFIQERGERLWKVDILRIAHAATGIDAALTDLQPSGNTSDTESANAPNLAQLKQRVLQAIGEDEWDEANIRDNPITEVVARNELRATQRAAVEEVFNVPGENLDSNTNTESSPPAKKELE